MDDAPQRRVLIVAGEPSGDAHAARLVRALRARIPCRLRGAAGPALIEAGVEPVVDMADLAVLGFSGIVRHLPGLWRAFRRLLAEADRFRPEVAILVDSPGFNLRLGPRLRRRGTRVFYYIAPQVWAWHPQRARAMSRWVDRLALVFPFEEPLFRAAGVSASFVGHPLLESLEPEVTPARLRQELGLGEHTRVLGLLPGSRRQEIRAHLPVMLAAAARLRSTWPDLAVVLPLAPGIEPGELERMRLGRLVDGGGARVLASRFGRVFVVTGRTRAVEAAATACAVASGTATLETALFGTPLAIVYRVGWINYAIARRLVRLPRIGLPNIVAEEAVAPELIQGDLTPARLAETLRPWLADAEARSAASDRLRVVRHRLGAPGASARAAELVLELLP